MIQFQCDSCGRKLQAKDGAQGKSCRCPKCKKMATIPDRVAGPPSAKPSGASTSWITANLKTVGWAILGSAGTLAAGLLLLGFIVKTSEEDLGAKLRITAPPGSVESDGPLKYDEIEPGGSSRRVLVVEVWHETSGAGVGKGRRITTGTTDSKPITSYKLELAAPKYLRIKPASLVVSGEERKRIELEILAAEDAPVKDAPEQISVKVTPEGEYAKYGPLTGDFHVVIVAPRPVEDRWLAARQEAFDGKKVYFVGPYLQKSLEKGGKEYLVLGDGVTNLYCRFKNDEDFRRLERGKRVTLKGVMKGSEVVDCVLHAQD